MQQVNYVYDPDRQRHVIYLRFPDDSYVEIGSSPTVDGARWLVDVLDRWHDNWLGRLPAAYREGGTFDPTGQTNETTEKPDRP